MSVKLELYRVFKSVCDYQSISEAAKSLFISQSAVSQSIKLLESQIGAPLFHRTKKGVTQTAEGKLLYEYVSSAMDLILVAEQKIDMMKNLSLGELKIGASDTLSRYILLPKLELYNREFPKIKLNIINRTTSEAISLLKSGKIDLAFINMPIADDEVEVTSYCEVQDVFVASPKLSLAKSVLSLQEIAELPLILLETKSNSRRYVEDFFNSNGIKITPEIELGSHDLLLEFARINLGVSCVIEQFSSDYLKSGELILIKTLVPIPKRSIGIARLKGVSLSNATKQFLQIIYSYLV